VLADICTDGQRQDPVGRAEAKQVKALHCELLRGKAKTNATTKVFGRGHDKQAIDLSKGTLTLKMGTAVTNGFYQRTVVQMLFPSVPWHRDLAASFDAVQRHITDWSEDKDGVDFKVEVDARSFAPVNWVFAHYVCGGNGNSAIDGGVRSYPDAAPFTRFIAQLWSTAKGKQILRKVKRVTCSVTTDVKGKAAKLEGDHLIFYGRVIPEGQEYKGQASFFMDRKERLPSNDAAFAYALFRRARDLGGECPTGYDDKETAAICGN